MKRILKKTRSKLRSKKGETLVEILVAILIIALSAGMFAAMYTASMNINLSAQKQDELFYEAVSTLEEMEKSEDTSVSDGQLQYSSDKHSESVDVEFWTKDGMSAYKGKEGTGDDTP